MAAAGGAAPRPAVVEEEEEEEEEELRCPRPAVHPSQPRHVTRDKTKTRRKLTLWTVCLASGFAMRVGAGKPGAAAVRWSEWEVKRQGEGDRW